MERAKNLFEEEAPPGEVWGGETPEAKPHLSFTRSGATAAASLKVISEDVCASSIQRAAQQLRDEGVMRPDQT